MADLVARIWGDPLVDDARGREIRQLLEAAPNKSSRFELCWSGVRGSERGHPVSIGDGGSGLLQLRSELPRSDLLAILGRLGERVPASSPLLVFADGDAVLQASLEFPEACAVIDARGRVTGELLEQIQSILSKVGSSAPDFAVPLEAWQACLDLPAWGDQDRRILHFAGSGDDPGSGLLLDCLQTETVEAGLRFVLSGATGASRDHWQRRLAELPDRVAWELVEDEPRATQFLGCRALVQPDQRFAIWQPWVMAMAAGRILIASRHAESARLLRAPGICIPIGGRSIANAFIPDPSSLRHALRSVMGEDSECQSSMRAIAERARHWVQMHLDPRQPAPRPAEAGSGRRAVLVLEAPIFERSSASILTLETARALQRSGKVDLRLKPSLPFKEDLRSLRDRYPDLVSCLSRGPAGADLWLRSGWPVAAHRPDARCFAVRVDWEYGAIPTEFTPVLSQEADRVIVHSRAVQRSILAAGADPERVLRIPHGVEAAAFNEAAVPLERVLAFKGKKLAVLFVGELIWRKGFDLWLKMLLCGIGRGLPICGVVKTPGGGSKYSGFDMRELLTKCMRDARGLEILTIDENLDSAEMAALYRACDLLLHPYRGEGFCLPVLEASACGLPVLATAGGSTDDFTDPSMGIPAARRLVDLAGAHVGRPFVLEPDAGQSVEIFVDRLERMPIYRAEAECAAARQREAHSWDGAAARLEQLAFEAMSMAPARPRPVCEIPMMTSSQDQLSYLPKDPMPQLLRS